VIELIRTLLLLGIAGAALTFAGSLFAWWMEEPRRLRRLVRKVLGGAPDGVIVAIGRGAAAGFRLASSQVVVMRSGGADALLYRLHSLTGAELIVDDEVAARVMRDEPRRVLDSVNANARHVTLRLLFDDARHPDFSLDLWLPADADRRHARQAAAAIREARSWLTRAEAIMRRAGAPLEAKAEVEAVEPEPMDEPELEYEPEDEISSDIPTSQAGPQGRALLPWEDDGEIEEVLEPSGQQRLL
jgi:hypothetical protein